ncbi:hypothetical protein [Candidatus Nitrososphaera gargensis]|nr:hypothetical protein [Candidatus Nitrososphaera gargensis]
MVLSKDLEDSSPPPDGQKYANFIGVNGKLQPVPKGVTARGQS